jgi:hypothetical protein
MLTKCSQISKNPSLQRFGRLLPLRFIHMRVHIRGDPTTWAKGWTAEIPWTKTKGPVYEWACHEGNTMISTILRGARVADADAAQKKGK